MQANPKDGAADIISRAPNAVFCQLQHLASNCATANPDRSAASAASQGGDACAAQASNVPETKRLRPSPGGRNGLQHPDNALNGSAHAAAGSDLPVEVPPQPATAKVTALPNSGTVSVASVSTYGVVRYREYAGPADVAAALVECMEDAPAALRAPFREFRVGGRATIQLLTWRCWEARRTAGACCRLFQGCVCYRGVYIKTTIKRWRLHVPVQRHLV